MGNACFRQPDYSPAASTVKLISYGGATTVLTGGHTAGEIMFQYPDHMVCRADSFFIGHPIPYLAIDDQLLKGQTYFLLPLPLDCFSQKLLSASSITALSGSHPRVAPVRFKECPFEYLKGPDGRVLIKVAPEFITRLITSKNNIVIKEHDEAERSLLCTTPELQKHYSQLVGSKSKNQTWSPKLHTIPEYNFRFSPCRFMGLEWKQTEARG